MERVFNYYAFKLRAKYLPFLHM